MGVAATSLFSLLKQCRIIVSAPHAAATTARTVCTVDIIDSSDDEYDDDDDDDDNNDVADHYDGTQHHYS